MSLLRSLGASCSIYLRVSLLKSWAGESNLERGTEPGEGSGGPNLGWGIEPGVGESNLERGSGGGNLGWRGAPEDRTWRGLRRIKLGDDSGGTNLGWGIEAVEGLPGRAKGSAGG